MEDKTMQNDNWKNCQIDFNSILWYSGKNKWIDPNMKKLLNMQL